MTSINYFFAYVILAGFGSAPSYATIVTSLIDMSFQHQKGRILSLYGIVLIAGNFLPPVPAGYIVDSQGWKWCFYYLIIFFAVSSVLVLVAAEETAFPRSLSNLMQSASVRSQPESATSVQDMQQTTHHSGKSDIFRVPKTTRNGGKVTLSTVGFYALPCIIHDSAEEE